MRRIGAVAGGCGGGGEGWRERSGAAAFVLAGSAIWCAGADRAAERPWAACGSELSRRERWVWAEWGAAWEGAGARGGGGSEPVHGAAGWASGAAEPAGGGRGHCGRQPGWGEPE